MDHWIRQLQDFIGVRNRPTARRDRVPQESGYDCTFVETPPEGLQTKCQICKFVLREPTQLQCCGDLYCAGCISTRQACPKCRQSNPASFSDTRIKESLLGLQVYCVHKAEEGERREGEGGGGGGGCEWVGKLRELDRHLNKNPSLGTRMNGCLYIEIKCRFCENSFKRSCVEDHQSNHCPNAHILVLTASIVALTSTSQIIISQPAHLLLQNANTAKRYSNVQKLTATSKTIVALHWLTVISNWLVAISDSCGRR